MPSGILRNWNDSRGFGFIKLDDASEGTFKIWTLYRDKKHVLSFWTYFSSRIITFFNNIIPA